MLKHAMYAPIPICIGSEFLIVEVENQNVSSVEKFLASSGIYKNIVVKL